MKKLDLTSYSVYSLIPYKWRTRWELDTVHENRYHLILKYRQKHKFKSIVLPNVTQKSWKWTIIIIRTLLISWICFIFLESATHRYKEPAEDLEFTVNEKEEIWNDRKISNQAKFCCKKSNESGYCWYRRPNQRLGVFTSLAM